MPNPSWRIATGRLALAPVGAADLAELQALKAEPRSFARLLGGVRSPTQTARELADEIAFWAAHGYGIWTIREIGSGQFLGIAGLMERADGRGVALRFALMPDAQGRGYASEAAGAVLRYAHERAGLARVIAVAQESNVASRQVLGAIGMRLCGQFVQDGVAKVEYESVRAPEGPAPSR